MAMLRYRSIFRSAVIATANSVQDIPRPLLDRMELIEVTSYTENEKLHIVKEHLLAKADGAQ